MRYLKVTLLIGFFVSALVAGLFEIGAFRQLDLGLGNFLGLRFAPVSDRWSQYPLFITLAFGVAWCIVDIPRTSLKAVIAAGVLGQLVTAVWVLNLLGFFFSPFASGVAILASTLIGFIYSRTEGGSRKKVIRSIFGDRISKKSFAKLLNSNIPLPFSGEMREASVVVCEVFNHDHLTEALAVPAYVAMNNSFLRNAADFLVERGGYLDECDGESLRVVFGTPLPDRNHALSACDAALALVKRLDDVNRECLREFKQMFDYRVGVNSGEMVVAAYGSRRLGTFSVAGEAVEWARRLCGANVIYGSRVIVGEQTFQMAEEGIEVRPLEMVKRHSQDKHREEIYELLGMKKDLPEEALRRRDMYWKGIVHYRARRWDEALAHFAKAMPEEGSDGPLELYVRRIEQLREGVSALEWNPARI